MATRYTLDTTDALAERVGATTGGTTTWYVRGWGEELSRETAGALTWYGQDQLGSVRLEQDATGSVTRRVDYDPWGVPAGEGSPQDYGFISTIAGPLEQAEAARFLMRVRVVPDAPSPRAQALTPTRNLQPNNIVILGTGDQLGTTTMTADARAVQAAAAQGVDFAVYLHVPVPLTGR